MSRRMRRPESGMLARIVKNAMWIRQQSTGTWGATRADPFFCLVCCGLDSFSPREPVVEDCKARSSPVSSRKKMLSGLVSPIASGYSSLKESCATSACGLVWRYFGSRWRDSIRSNVAVVDGGSDWRYRLPSREDRRGVVAPYLIEASAYFEVQKFVGATR